MANRCSFVSSALMRKDFDELQNAIPDGVTDDTAKNVHKTPFRRTGLTQLNSMRLYLVYKFCQYRNAEYKQGSFGKIDETGIL